MAIIKGYCVALLLAMTSFALASPTVTDVTAKQRYPWNGLVDISCKVTGMAETTAGSDFVVAAVMPDSGNVRAISHFWVVQGGTNSTDRMVRTNGDYHLLWDARADLGNVRYTNMVVRVTLDSPKVQLWEEGPYWATTNIGAEEPWEYGYYFWWGDTVGYKRENDAWVASDGSSSNFSFRDDPVSMQTYNKDIATLQGEGWIVSQDGTNVLAPEHDAAQVQWGGGWRMPTKRELSDLNNKCTWTWTTVNGVNGLRVSGKGDYVSASIFLPCSGCGYGTSLSDAGLDGEYWSSVPRSDYYRYAWSLYFASSGHFADDSSRYYGRSVRPVQGSTK